MPAFNQDARSFFQSDGADDAIARRRQAGFERLGTLFAERFPKTLALTRETRTGLSDLQFTSAYRVPFPFSKRVRETLGTGAFLDRSEGPVVIDLDGNRLIDLTGSYGVNLFGYDFYKQTIAEGSAMVADLGPVLGAYHPVVADNVRRLTALSGMDEVSFHMSGTEAVMQAVRLARYHTGRDRLVRFAGAYHGWWGEVQPGIGNPVPADRTLTLADLSEKALQVLATRKDIACVLVNPLQALHPNGSAPSDNQLVDSSRRAGTDLAAYRIWLHRLADTCRANGIVLIFDEVFLGFRLAPGGAAEYFGVRPDLVTYGKTLGGGLPVGVLAGRADLMRRWNDERPLDICFARGTFNAHPYVMGAMNAFLRRLETPEIRALYDGIDARWDARAAQLNRALEDAGAPIRVAHLQTVWTMLYTKPAAYNWMLQYYLRAEGLALSWVGTGRLIFSLDIDDALFADIVHRFAAAARAMVADGWWDTPDGLTDKALRRAVLKQAVRARLGR
jgi:glutamate-1-semialdehyde 2,1-aminomutase